MITYCIITAFINALAGVVLGLSVLLKGPRNRRNHVFAWFTASFVVWSWFYVRWQLAGSEEEALRLARVLTGASIFIPITYFHFVIRLVEKNRSVEIAVGYLLALGVSAFTFTPWLVESVEPRLMFPHWPQKGPVFYPYILIFGYYTVRAWVLSFQGYRAATHWRRKQLGYVCLSTMIGWIGGLTNFLLWFEIPVPPVGNGLALVYIGGVSYAMMRFRLVDVDEFIIKGIVYLLAVSGLSLSYFLLIAGLPQLVPTGFPQLENSAGYLAAFLVTLLFFLLVPPLRRALDAFLELRVLSARSQSRERLREFTGRIAAINDLRTLYTDAVEAVSRALDADSVALYARAEFSSDLHLESAVGPGPAGGRQRSLTPEAGWLGGLPIADRALVLYELEEGCTAAERATLDELRRAHQVELILPISEAGNLHGLILIGRCRDHRLFGDVDIALLESLALRIALTIRARQLERQANHAEKLISLGTLAAGVAHELRNPLVSIRTFSALIEEQGADPEFRREFRGVVARDVERIASIVDNVSAFADNAPVRFSPVRPSEVLRGVRDISAPDFRAAGVELVLPEATSCEVSGNYSQLLQVFINLFQNALHALEGRPAPCIRVNYRRGPETASGPTMIIDVADNGAGIDEAVSRRIFEPFVTTKSTGDETTKRGMGLGLAIVKRIVEAHGGSITVASQAGVGTTFSVQLPCLKK